MSNDSDGIAFNTALVVDDDPILREVAKSALLAVGVQDVEVATSGLDALARLQGEEWTFDLIVSDLQMPGMDGISFFRALGERDHAGALVVLSSMDNDVLQLARRLAGSHGLNILGVLSKPVSMERLKVLLRAPDRAEATAGNQTEEQSEPDLDELRDAIRTGQFHPYYQAKVSIASGLVTSAETLARWHHPVRGIVSPKDFIAPMERHGLIPDLTWSMTHAALTDAREIVRKSPDFKIAVNFSANQILDRQLPERLKGLLDSHGIAPANLQIEVTEDKLLELSVDALEVFGRLRLLGIELSIDDFGTGQANLTTLRDFPFTELKIDRSFVAAAPSDLRARESVIACVNMGRNLGMRIVAEGIETEEQLQLVSRIGVDEVQGFLFSKPAPMSSLIESMSFPVLGSDRPRLEAVG